MVVKDVLEHTFFIQMHIICNNQIDMNAINDCFDVNPVYKLYGGGVGLAGLA